MFGCGLGLTGLDVAPALIDFFTMTYGMFWVLGLFLGQLAYDGFERFVFSPKVQNIQGEMKKEIRSEINSRKVEAKLS